jgi:lysozyme
VYGGVAGFPTIGYGHRINPGESYPSGVTVTQAESLLLRDETWAGNVVDRLVKVSPHPRSVGALVDFTFTLGGRRLASSTLLRDLNAGHYDEAGQQLLMWDRSGGREIPGLKARREAERQLWLAARRSV